MIQRLLPFFTLIALFLGLSIGSPHFLTSTNLSSVVRQTAVINITALGMTLIIIAGGIDLSVGAILAFATNIGGQGIVLGWPIWVVYPLMLALGLALGLLNGYLVTRIAVPALIITLGTMNIYRGVLMVITKGRYITPIPAAYQAVGTGFVPFLFLVVVLAAFMFVTLRTRFGRNLFAIGGGEQAALYSGVPVRRNKVVVYAISGVLSALAGIILVGRSGFIQPQSGMGYEMSAIAAVVIGGTSITGGSGSVLGTFFGSVLLGLILAGLTMLAVNPYWIGLITGALIILAIALDSLRRARR